MFQFDSLFDLFEECSLMNDYQLGLFWQMNSAPRRVSHEKGSDPWAANQVSAPTTMGLL